jgi:hypothetical protein
MSTAQIKQKLHDYIDSAEDRKLKAIYTLLEDEISEDYALSNAQKKEIDKRLIELENGIGRTYKWDEVVAITDKALADRKNDQ